MVELTLNCIARGGVYDQIGGGFHRYSVDRYWHVPHFEKMLYDNALMLKAYLLGLQFARKELYVNVAMRNGRLDNQYNEISRRSLLCTSRCGCGCAR